MLDRRQSLGAASTLALPALSAQGTALATALVQRHTAAEPGIGDPPGYRLDRCASQRKLSAEGPRQARAIGQRLTTSGWRSSAVLTSQSCRCPGNASGIVEGRGLPALAVTVLDALDSHFDQRSRGAAQTAAQRLGRTKLADARGFELWVTHHVNMSDLTGRVVTMGEGVWLIRGSHGPILVDSFSARVACRRTPASTTLEPRQATP
jgi:phosphohistidine phosphatase SixA